MAGFCGKVLRQQGLASISSPLFSANQMSTVPKALFFSVEETAQELGLRTADVIWSFAKGSIQRQRINSTRFINTIRFTSDQIVAAAQRGTILKDVAAHLPFEESANPTWFEVIGWYEFTDSLQSLRNQIKEKSAVNFTEEQARERFVNKNPKLVNPSYAQQGNQMYDRVELEITPEFSRAGIAVVSPGIELNSPYERVMAYHLMLALKAKAASESTKFLNFYSSNPLFWLCDQIIEKRGIIAILGHPDEVIRKIHQISWVEAFRFIRNNDVTIDYKVPGTSVFSPTDMQRVAAKLGL